MHSPAVMVWPHPRERKKVMKSRAFSAQFRPSSVPIFQSTPVSTGFYKLWADFHLRMGGAAHHGRRVRFAFFKIFRFYR